MYLPISASLDTAAGVALILEASVLSMAVSCTDSSVMTNFLAPRRNIEQY